MAKMKNISSASTNVLASRPGILRRIVNNATAASTITVYDNTAASGTKIATLKASAAEGSYTYEGSFLTGLTVVTAGASDITVVWE
jgi:hypothetical protein